jgi:hypothetical protein
MLQIIVEIQIESNICQYYQKILIINSNYIRFYHDFLENNFTFTYILMLMYINSIILHFLFGSMSLDIEDNFIFFK